MSKFPCIESTLDYRVFGHAVRLWIDKKELPENNEVELKIISKLKEMPISAFRPSNDKELIEKLLELIPQWVPDIKINAIQVRAGDTGLMVYCVPF